MQLKNRFQEEEKNRIWSGHPFCAKCSSNRMCSLHHIFGTASGDIKHSIMLCHDCHKIADSFNVVGGVKGKEFQEWALDYTARLIRDIDMNTI